MSLEKNTEKPEQENPEKVKQPENVSETEKQGALNKRDQFFKGFKQPDSKSYKMNSEATIDHMTENYKKADAKMDDKEKADRQARGVKSEQEEFKSRLDAGVDNKVKLKGTKEEFFLTGKEASGQFLAKEHPGDNPKERQENYQLPPTSDTKNVYKATLNKPSIVIESKVAPQKEWAKEAGYEAKEGKTQEFVPTSTYDWQKRKDPVTVKEQVAGDEKHRQQREADKKKDPEDK